ncbi:hypothetical protein FIV53_02980 [Mycoplasma nasistruthionis]|uniref:Uncharacterized protein n=1 Tax=Mycoplasma nasistruthionis TaxID=353852 RepID=A0A4Y6I7C7_9MOLU|nr:hypothetical protein FIV53_02980 [Mycoplasma nasistruthionis]
MKNELTALLANKNDEITQYADVEDRKYTLASIKTTLENAYTAAESGKDGADNLEKANKLLNDLKTAVEKAKTDKSMVEKLAPEVKTMLLDRFNKMFELKQYHGVNTTLFDVYNEAAVSYYNQDQKLDLAKLTEIKEKITKGLETANAAKETANTVTPSVKKIGIVKGKQITEARSNNDYEYAIDGNTDLSIPVLGWTDGYGHIAKDSELIFSFKNPTRLKHIILHQFAERVWDNKDKSYIVKNLTLHGQRTNGGWEQIATYNANNQDFAELSKFKDYKFKVPQNMLNNEYKAITLKSNEQTNTWWAVKDVEIVSNEEKKIFIETPVVVSTVDQRQLLNTAPLTYKNPSTETYKKEYLFDNNESTFNTYQNSTYSEVERSWPIIFDFLKPMNIHSINLKQDALLKLPRLKMILVDEENHEVVKQLDNLETLASWKLESEHANKKFKRLKFEYYGEGNDQRTTKKPWQINDIEIL